jgi:hypothetical protein
MYRFTGTTELVSIDVEEEHELWTDPGEPEVLGGKLPSKWEHYAFGSITLKLGPEEADYDSYQQLYPVLEDIANDYLRDELRSNLWWGKWNIKSVNSKPVDWNSKPNIGDIVEMDLVDSELYESTIDWLLDE